MEEHQKRKIESILRKIKNLLAELEESISAESSATTHRKARSKSISANMQKLNEEIAALDRDAALDRLKELTHKELGELFLLSGGSSVEKKRPKEWLVERIVWQLFDYKHGLETIRGPVS